jgi:energy-coupling factor transport system ATP-binding protein
LSVAISVEGLTFRYAGRKRPALRDVTFDVAEGEVVLVLGPSGCGKSTLALCLNGMIPHVVAGELAGSVRIHGQPLGGRPLADTVRQVGIVFQDPEAQLCMLRVGEEIAFGLENLAVPAAEMPRRIQRALELTGLQCSASSRVDWLSGGNKQRLALACVLAMEPSVLIFDEPTANLDPSGAQAVFATLARLKAEGRHTIVVVEHRLDQLMHLIDRTLVFGPDGALLDDGEPHQVLERQAEALDAFGIWKPQVTEVVEGLRRRGAFVGSYPITVGEAEVALANLSGDNVKRGTTSPLDPLVQPHIGEAAVSIRGLSAAYGRGPRVLEDVHLEVSRGDILALVGPNGSGKSTLAHHLIATLRAPRHTVFVEDRDIRDMPDADLAQMVGYVFQNPEHQFVAHTVFDELAYGPRLRGWPEVRVKARVDAMLSDFGLSGLAPANPFKLSHGEKRRLSVATMLILEQRVLVLDEPTFGQDRRHARGLLDKFQALNETGTTLMIITHDMRLVAENANRVAVLDAGRVLARSGVDELFADEALLEKAHLEVPPIRALSQRLFGGSTRVRLPATVTELVDCLAPERVAAAVRA